MAISRSEARRVAFELIFQGNCNTADEALELLFENDSEESPKYKGNIYISSTVKGVEDKLAVLDDIISSNLPNDRSIERLSRVVLSILRLSTYEMMFVDDIPNKVSINEAIELTKKYGDELEPRFVNGVLSGVYKSLEK